jgi:hypothetical protein
MKPRSHTLFHFTKSVETLESILANGFWPRYCLEDFDWYNPETGLISYPMVCFCDIPLTRIDTHVKFYGSYGLGLTKRWAMSKKLSPVIYISKDTNVSNALTRMLHKIPRPPTESYVGSAEDIISIIAHVKKIVGDTIVDGKPVQKEFYQENEWRYIADFKGAFKGALPQWITKKDHSSPQLLSFYNEMASSVSPLQFSAKDIKYIFVKSDKDIPKVIDFIQAKLTHYTEHDRKILSSRIISLKSINIDL